MGEMTQQEKDKLVAAETTLYVASYVELEAAEDVFEEVNARYNYRFARYMYVQKLKVDEQNGAE